MGPRRLRRRTTSSLRASPSQRVSRQHSSCSEHMSPLGWADGTFMVNGLSPSGRPASGYGT